MPDLVGFDAVEAAARRLEDKAVETPFLASPLLSEASGARVRLKAEGLQRTGSFKFRGAFNCMAARAEADPEALAAGVVTYSSGNHAQAVAAAAAERGLRAVVVMPVDAPTVKREGARRHGAEIVEEGRTSEERRERAEAIREREGLAMIPPFDDPDIIAGQGTCAREAALAWPQMDTWLVCIGGGGFGSGSAVALRGMRPGVRIIGVEAEGAASMRASLDAGRPITLASIRTIADGLAPVRPGDLTYAHVEALFDDVVTVPDEAIRAAARHMVVEERLVVEYSGAAAVAALMTGAAGDLSGRNVGVTLSGSNMDVSVLAELLGKGGDPPGTRLETDPGGGARG